MRVCLVVVLVLATSPAAAQPYAYVLGNRMNVPDLVTVLDTATLQTVTTIPVGNGLGSSTIFGAGIAASPDGRRVYVVNSVDQTISVIDTTTNTVRGAWASGPNPSTIIVSPDSSRLYVGNGSTVNSVALIRVISTANGATIGTISLGGPPVYTTNGIALSRDGRRLYATAWGAVGCGGHTVKVIDTAAGAVVRSVPVPTRPTGLALTPDGAVLYAASMGATCTYGEPGLVTVIDTSSNTSLGSIPGGVEPYALDVSPDGQRVFVAGNAPPHPVTVINRATQTVTGSFTGGQYMTDIVFAPDGLRAFAPWSAGVAVLNAVTLTSAGSVPFDPATVGTPVAIVIRPMPTDLPTDLFASIAEGNRVTLHWRPPAAGVPTGYVVEGGLAPGEVAASLPTGSALPLFNVAAPSGVFYMRVHALFDGVRGGPSDDLLMAVNPPQPPGPPAGLVGLASGSSIFLAWRNGALGGMANGHTLSVSGAVNTQLPLPAFPSFSFAGVPPGTYTLAVHGVNAFGTSGPSNSVTLTFPGACPGPPLAPADMRIYKAGSQVYVYWEPADTGPAPVSYVLRVSGAFTGAFPTTGRTLNGTVGPGSYAIRVAAVNPCGEGPATLPQTITVP